MHEFGHGSVTVTLGTGSLREICPGSVTLREVFRGTIWPQQEVTSFLRIAKACPDVEKVPTKYGPAYAVSVSKLGVLEECVISRSGRSGRHRWEGAESNNTYAGSLTTAQAAQALDLNSRNSVYHYEKKGVETQLKDGRRLWNRKQIEGIRTRLETC